MKLRSEYRKEKDSCLFPAVILHTIVTTQRTATGELRLTAKGKKTEDYSTHRCETTSVA